MGRDIYSAASLPWHRPTGQDRCGGIEYCLGTPELGHIHGDRLLDIPFPKTVRDEIVDTGLAEPHHSLPDTGWVSFYLRAEEDVQKAIALLRRSYEIASKQKRPRNEGN
jgi:hypothetical protein